MNGHIIGSNKLNVTLQQVAGPMADQAVLNVPAADGVKVITFGGLTKLEALAGQIVGHVKEPTVAVEMAQAVLDECQKRQTPTQPAVPG